MRSQWHEHWNRFDLLVVLGAVRFRRDHTSTHQPGCSISTLVREFCVWDRELTLEFLVHPLT